MFIILCVFYSDNFGKWEEKICYFVKKDKVFFFNFGIEVVEVVIKIVRKWGFEVKGIIDG